MKAKYALITILALGPCAYASEDCGDALDLYREAKYAEAEAVASKYAKKAFCARVAGDAAFMQGKDNYYRYYASALAEDFDTSFYLTKGDSPIFKALAGLTAALGVAADHANAQQGIQSNNTVVAFDTANRMYSSLSSSIGAPEYRETVKATMKDLRRIARGKSDPYPVVYPIHRNVPGFSMSRIHVGSSICNAIRRDEATFVTTSECYFGGSTIDGAFVTVRAALMDFEVAKVVTTSSPYKDWVFINIGSEQRMYLPGGYDDAWSGQNYVYDQKNLHAVTWFSDDFSKLVPYVKVCKLARLSDCAEEIRNGALIWVYPKSQSDGWYFVGQGLSSGEFLRSSWP